MFSGARKESFLRDALWSGYLRFACIDRCEVGHDEVIYVGGDST